MLQKLGDPLAVLSVCLAPWNRFDVLCVCQHNVKVSLKHVPDWFPVHAGRFHCNVLNAELTQPGDEFTKFARCASEAANMFTAFLRLLQQNTSSNGGLMNIESAAPRVQGFHGSLLCRGT